MSRFNLSECNERQRKLIERAIAAQDSAGSPRQNTKLECAFSHESLAQNQSQKGTARKLHIKFVSVRKRLCDPDNLSVKWLLDCLRYCGAIKGDEPDKITLEVHQEKCPKGKEEYTTIEITPI